VGRPCGWDRLSPGSRSIHYDHYGRQDHHRLKIEALYILSNFIYQKLDRKKKGRQTMSTLIPVFYIVLLLGLMLLGLVLLAVGIALLLKLKNKLAGALTTVIGAVFILFPVVILLALVPTTRVLG
jgi:hypothetical protein